MHHLDWNSASSKRLRKLFGGGAFDVVSLDGQNEDLFCLQQERHCKSRRARRFHALVLGDDDRFAQSLWWLRWRQQHWAPTFKKHGLRSRHARITAPVSRAAEHGNVEDAGVTRDLGVAKELTGGHAIREVMASLGIRWNRILGHEVFEPADALDPPVLPIRAGLSQTSPPECRRRPDQASRDRAVSLRYSSQNVGRAEARSSTRTRSRNASRPAPKCFSWAYPSLAAPQARKKPSSRRWGRPLLVRGCRCSAASGGGKA